MPDRDPNILVSGLSRSVSADGVTVDVQIYRLEHERQWALEVINEEGTSILWDSLFDTDEEALAAFQLTVDEEGMDTFLDDDNVIPFPTQH